MATEIQRESIEYRHLEEAQKAHRDQRDQPNNAPQPPKLLPFKIENKHARECMSEFLSAFIYCAFGLGVIAQVTLSKAQAGDYLSVSIAWGIAVAMGMHVGGGVSHSHLNPAITITLAVYDVFPWKKVPGYVLSQIFGAFMGSLMIYTMFYQLIHAVDPQKVATATIFHTHPNAAVDNSAAFITEMFATMVLMICLLSLVDEKNRPTVVPSFPSCVGLLVVGIGSSFSLISSAALNPARDLGPRIMLALVGYEGVFSSNHSYFWIPIVAPILGAILGAGIYVLLVMGHHPAIVSNKNFF